MTKERYKEYEDLLSLVGLVSTWMFGLVGLCVWLIVTLIGRYVKK